MSRTRVIVAWICVGLMSAPAVTGARDGWRAVGRKAKWAMSVPSGWIGGSADQIERVRGTLENEGLRNLMQGLWYKARAIDAYFVNTDVEGVTTQEFSSVEVNVVKEGFRPEMFTDETWREFSALEQKDAPAGARTAFVASRRLSVGGFPCHCATFRTTLAQGGVVNAELCFVLLDAQRTHTFRFKADEVKYAEHRRDFQSMLASLTYD